MPRYFIEVSYKGTAYSGFQIQKNGFTIQEEIEKALHIFFRQSFSLTGSSRTDAGVHALQNYFHFDVPAPLPEGKTQSKAFYQLSDFEKENSNANGQLLASVYNLNAILPRDIVIKRMFEVSDNMHCRFDAISREYKYYIYTIKDPFLQDTAFYYPYKLDLEKLNLAATLLPEYQDFTSFSKRNTQVKHFICEIQKSEWIIENNVVVYQVKANRFLRGMVKGLVGTMLKVGRGIISLEEFRGIIENRDCTKADFSVPSKGLVLIKVNYEFNQEDLMIQPFIPL